MKLQKGMTFKKRHGVGFEILYTIQEILDPTKGLIRVTNDLFNYKSGEVFYSEL
jgi:hypothetical protein